MCDQSDEERELTKLLLKAAEKLGESRPVSAELQRQMRVYQRLLRRSAKSRMMLDA